MWSIFLFENGHFAVNLLAALVFLAIAWLHFDAWLGKKTTKEALKIAGFSLLAASFFSHALVVESLGLTAPLLPATVHFWLTQAPRLIGFLLLGAGTFIDPLQPQPAVPLIFLSTPLSANPATLLPLSSIPLSLGVALLFLRRATTGLERHLLPVSIGFFLLSISEIFGLASLFSATIHPAVLAWIAPFGPLWFAEHAFLLIATLVLGRWVFSYLLKRLLSQLFMIITLCILTIFLLTTVSFTALLLKSLETESTRQITTDAKVLAYALDTKKQEALTAAAALAQNPATAAALTATSSGTSTLKELTRDHLLAKKQSQLVVIDATGQVIARGEDSDKPTDNLSADPAVTRALDGADSTSLVAVESVLAPQLSIVAAVPVKTGDQVIGAVVAGNAIDNAFVDGVKAATGLESSIYGGDAISATTLVSEDGTSRPVGLKVANSRVTQAVLDQNQPFAGPVSLQSTSYLAAFLPLTDADNTPLGMLSVARPQIEVLSAASRSIQFTFVIAAALLVLSIAPVVLISRYLTRQIK